MATVSSILSNITMAAPSFRSPDDKIAFAVHAAFVAAGYHLKATGATGAAAAPDPPTDGPDVGTAGWNELDDSYAFVYTKTVGGVRKAVLVKCVPVGNGLTVDVMELKDRPEDEDVPLSVQIRTSHHLVESEGPVEYDKVYRNLECLVENLNAGVFSKLEPATRKDSGAGEGSSGSNRRSERVTPELYYVPPPQSSGIIYPPVPAGGNSDLYPGAPAGFYPQRPGYGGDMLVGPRDPRWFGVGQQPGFPGGIPGVPPGARFDPIGPPDVPGFEPGRFVRQPPRRPGNGTHPDLEHFQGPDYF